MTDLKALFDPFPPEQVTWRVGSTNADKTKGMALAFIDARDVMERLDTVCGPAGWQCRYPHANGKTVCEIGIKVGEEWVWKADGAGDTDVEAEKGALSDAFKRAAVRWGVGRYLYAMPSPWVEIEQKGRTSIIKPGERAKLAMIARNADAYHPDEPSAAVNAATVAIGLCTSVEALDGWAADNKAVLDSLPPDDLSAIRKAFAEHRKTLPQPKKEAA